MIKYYILLIIRTLSKILFVFPIHEKRILFYSFSGKEISDSPRYIAEYIYEHRDLNYEIIWAVDQPEKWKYICKDEWKIIKYKSLAHVYYTVTSKYIITNTGPFKAVANRKKQEIINTWHGGGAYKKTGVDNPYKDKYTVLYIKNLSQAGVTLFLSSSKAFSKYAIKGAFLYKGNIVECGLPRNDILFKVKLHNAIRLQIMKTLCISGDKKLILFAPTWRNYSTADVEKLDVQKVINACKERFGQEWCMLFRGHNLSNGISVTANNIYYDVTNYRDMQELIIASDILISDYSSCIWDFSLTGKPCFLFTPDLKKYDNTFDFYTPINSWGFDVCMNNIELVNRIRGFNEEKYAGQIRLNHKIFGNCESGDACETVWRFISNRTDSDS